MFLLLCTCPLANWANFVIHRMYSNWVFRSSRILTWIVIFFGISQKCFMVVPKETKSQSECVDWFRSNQVEIFNKGGIADIGPSFHTIELLSRELLQYLKSQKSPGCVFLLISSSHYSCVLFHDYIAVTLVWLFG